MPFPFTLSTTSHLTFQSSFTSSTHPSLPSAATSNRSLARSSLKTHKRLPSADQGNHLTTISNALTVYLKYLATLDLALSGKPIPTSSSRNGPGEEVDITLASEPSPAWRPTLSSALALPSRSGSDRVSSHGLDYEIFFTHHTLAVIHTLLARQSLLPLYLTTGPTLTTQQRLNSILTATKHLKQTYILHHYLCQRATLSPDGPPTFPPSAVDVQIATQQALADLTHAELNLLTVLKDDPYPGLIAQSRNKDDREWMIKAPTIPKVRAQVLRRLCVGAGEKANSALAGLRSVGFDNMGNLNDANPKDNSSKNLSRAMANMTLGSSNASKVNKDLLEYCEDLRRTARAKACRFSGIDADLAGETGKGIAWLHAGIAELGLEIPSNSTSSSASKSSSSPASGFSRLKSSLSERREDKRIERGKKDWGLDGGKFEEARILEYLEKKLSKENDTVNVQLVPEWKPLLAEMPSGMSMPVDERWTITVLEEDELARMRAPLDLDDADSERVGSSDDEDERGQQGGGGGGGDGTKKAPAGAFPGTDGEYSGGNTSYY